MSTAKRRRQKAPTLAASHDGAVLRALIIGVIALVPAVMWRSASDVFALPKMTVIMLGAIAAVTFWAVSSAWHRQATFPYGPFIASASAFLAALAVTTATSSQVQLSFWGEYERYAGMAGYAAYVVIGIVTSLSFSQPRIRLLLRTIAIAATTPVAYGLLQAVNLDPWSWNDLGFVDVFSTFGNSNLFSGFTSIVAPIGLWLSLDTRTTVPWRATGGAVAAGSVAAGMASKSFQGPVAAAVGMGIVLAVWAWGRISSKADEPARLGRPLLAFGLAIAVGSLLLAGPLRSEVSDGLGERRYFWSTAMTIFTGHPVVGTGPDTFGQHFLAERPVAHADRFGDAVADSPHSVPLGMLSNGGGLLFTAYLGVMLVTVLGIGRALRAGQESRWLVAGLGGAWAAYVVQSLVSFDVPSHALLHWVLAGSVAAVSGTSVPRRLTLRGKPVTYKRGSGQRTSTVSGVTWTITLANIAAALVVLHVVGIRPLLADVSAGTGFRSAESGRLDASLSKLEDATSTAPWRSRYWVLRAALLEQVPNYGEALTSLEEAARREPGSSEYAVFAARVANQLGDVQRSEFWYTAAVRRNPRSSAVLSEAVQWGIEHDLDWAQGVADRSTRSLPESPLGWLLVARVAAAEGDDARARRAFLEALDRDPSSLEAANGLAQLMRRT